jgi:hypothetical protein
VGAVVSIAEARRLRLRRETSVLNLRCRDLIVSSLDAWRTTYVHGPLADRSVSLQRIRVLTELLAAIRGLG